MVVSKRGKQQEKAKKLEKAKSNKKKGKLHRPFK
jgi:hypothetical protein